MTAEARTDLHHRTPRCLLGHFDAAVGGLADWSEIERWGVEVRGLSDEDLSADRGLCPRDSHHRASQVASGS
jgi:hypothetical protein